MHGLLDMWKKHKTGPSSQHPVAGGVNIKYDQLEEYLKALSHGRRLELLHLLQVPRCLPDIRLTPGKQRAGDAPDRPVSRQAVQRHLDTLLELGLVVAHPAQDGRAKEFVVDRQRVYQVLEELRRVGMLTAASFVSDDVTVEAGRTQARVLKPGPKLVLVHGYVEGKVYPLAPRDPEEEGGWMIGRKPDLSISLDYDPFVSLVNSEIVLRGDGYHVQDLGTSKNGTWLNWQPVGADGSRLNPGDVLGVGRSLLVFQAE